RPARGPAQVEAVVRRGKTALEAERRRLGAVSAAEVRGRDPRSIDAPAVDRAHAAAPLAGAARVGPELVLEDRVRVDELVQLRVRRPQPARTDDGAEVIPAVEPVGSARAALAHEMDV